MGASDTLRRTGFANQLNKLSSRFFPRTSRQDPSQGGKWSNFHLERSNGKNSIKSTWASDLQNCEIINRCCFNVLKCYLFSHVQLFSVTPWTVAKPPLSLGFSRQKYWSGLPCPPPGDLYNPGTEPRSPALQMDSLLSEPPAKFVIICQTATEKKYSSQIWI